jgi:hypothetical protein
MYFKVIDFVDGTDAIEGGSGDGAETMPHVVFLSSLSAVQVQVF